MSLAYCSIWFSKWIFRNLNENVSYKNENVSYKIKIEKNLYPKFIEHIEKNNSKLFVKESNSTI